MQNCIKCQQEYSKECTKNLPTSAVKGYLSNCLIIYLFECCTGMIQLIKVIHQRDDHQHLLVGVLDRSVNQESEESPLKHDYNYQFHCLI